MPPTYDSIDTIVARLYDIEPAMLAAEGRKERAVLARFTAIRLRIEFDPEASIESLSRRYNRSESPIRHALKQAQQFWKTDRSFRLKFQHAREMLSTGRQPYAPELLHRGAMVWTRPTSDGEVVMGVVTNIASETFTVESFDNPDYKTINQIDTGRQMADYESSRDILYIGA